MAAVMAFAAAQAGGGEDRGRKGRRRRLFFFFRDDPFTFSVLLSFLCWPAAPHLSGLLALVGVLNFLAATSDIAADGLAVDVLSEDELGWGNTAQVGVLHL